VLQQIAQLMRDPKFSDKFVFVEDYDINVGRHLTQGVDVWLNNPRRPLEASGTSGQKVVLNGGLNLSVLDGWWAEAYDGLNGFAIGAGRTHSNMDVHDTRDGEDLYRVLRDELIPLYDCRACSALVLRRLCDCRHLRMMAQIVAQRSAEDTHPRAVDDPNPRQACHECPVEKFLYLVLRLVRRAADHVDLPAHAGIGLGHRNGD